MPNTTDTDRLLTPEELAAQLGISRHTVVAKARRGVYPCVRVGKLYRFRPDTAAQLKAEQ